MAFRTMLSSKTNFKPFKLVFGREMRIGVYLLTPFAEENLIPRDYLLSIIADLEEIHKCARKVMDAKFERAGHRLSAKALRKFCALAITQWLRQRPLNLLHSGAFHI